MKIYTKAGDRGDTGLLGDTRVPKDHGLLEAYGTIDELNASLGLLSSEDIDASLRKALTRIQNELFGVGTDLAAPYDSGGNSLSGKIVRFSDEPTQRLEQEIDTAEAKLKPLRQFILPRGSRASGLLHLSRTICRRAERRIAPLVREGKANPAILVFVNRLSDWLFVMARSANHRAGISDVPWEPN
ncbi:MAG TPA: cob(I)yrinic acid a,c-diamide adenosyltransferase [Bdellovibrionota bacterium]|nr:cob(I)yrinic acid a,c-diamide adenosyltransferase [Bdellovibrionota bacterium]